MIVNKHQLAEVLGKSERTLTEYQDDGMPIESVGGRGIENQYDTAKVIDWLIQRSVAGKSVMTPRDQRDFYEARLSEMEVARQAGLLAPTVDMLKAWEGAVLAARADLLGMGPRLKASVDARYGIDLDQQMVDDEIHGALQKLSDKPPEIDLEDEEPADEIEDAAA